MTDALITVDVVHEEELSADGFDLFVTVRGSSVFTGRSAFEKAAEVKTLVAALVGAGIVREDVSLVGVRVDVESGLLSKSSSARYSLRIRAKDTEKLGSVLTVIASAKNATVDTLDWRYPEGEEAKALWLRAAVGKARTRADAMADALGVTVTGVKRVSSPVAAAGQPVARPEPHTMMLSAAYGGAPGMARHSAGSVDLGLDVAPTKRIQIDVRVELTAAPRS